HQQVLSVKQGPS
ncbi:hypothetical protein CP061683_1062, partial [Chlamydia psittaci 06-1683]